MKIETTALLFVSMLIIAKQRIQLCLEKYLFYARSWDRGIWYLCVCVCVCVCVFFEGEGVLATIRFTFFLSYFLLVKNVEIEIHKTVIWLLF